MTEPGESLETVLRRTAKSGNVSYGEPVVLHEASRTRVRFVPFFIPHTDGTTLACKIATEAKSKSPMLGFVYVDQKSVSLQEPAARLLLQALKTHLKVAESTEDGDFIVLRVSGGIANLGTHDPRVVAQALSAAMSEPQIAKHLEGVELSAEVLAAFRGAIRLKEMKGAVAALRKNLDSDEADERVYQDWCERHTWAFGNAYVVRDEVRNISTGDRLDLLLPTVIAGYRDLVELKRPDMTVLNWDKAHKNYYFSSELSSAIGQCHRYLDVLHEVAANGLLDHPEIVAYHPRAIIVIGRSQDWDESRHRGLHGLNRRLNGIVVMTYDQLLAQGERLVQILEQSPAAEDSQASEWDDNVPF